MLGNLRLNVAINNLEPRVSVHAVALGERGGGVEFAIGRDSTNGVAEVGESWCKLRRVRFDTIVDAVKPCKIKMDVEGYEEQFIAGAGSTLQTLSLKVIEFETTSAVVAKTLHSRYFTQPQCSPFERFAPHEPVSATTQNLLKVRDCEFVQARISTARQISLLARSFLRL